MSSWLPKVGGVLTVVGFALKQHPLTLPWSELVTELGVGLVAFTARQNNVTSEQAGAVKKENTNE